MLTAKRSSAFWRALASPARRRMLDLLRDGAKSTGELAVSFPKLSRFAVMQHLRVLTHAKLVLVRREGRFRFNYLNAVPLVQIYERWVSTYAAPMAHASLALKRYVEGDPMKKSPTDFRVAAVELEVRIDAPPQRVWDALVNRTTNWWRKDFFTNPKTQAFRIEPRPGGRMYEDWGEDNGLVWATVLAVEAPHMIQFLGILTAQYGGPAHTVFQFSVESLGDGSVVKISDTIFGNIAEVQGSKMQEGWLLLFEQGLKPYVERESVRAI